MFIKQLYTGCLSEASYFIASNGQAAVVDPLRDIDTYLQLAAEQKASIKYIFETHFHADFVSGHLELAKATGAVIVYGPGAEAAYPIHVAKDEEVFRLGDVSMKALHTPGHTLESTCYLLIDENGANHCVFTGDTLFVGDVGRPDLAQRGEELTMFDLAGMLYQSIQRKLVPLADDVIVYPGHGAGSACGKQIGSATSTTIGAEKQSNYALKADSAESFVAAVTEGLPTPPAYFPVNAQINKQGYESLDAVLHSGLRPLSVEEVKKYVNQDAIIVDTRPAAEFTQGFLPGSLFIGLEGRFAEWAGSLIPFEKTVVLVCEPGREKEAIIRLARVGLDRIAGYLNGGFDAWKKAGEQHDMIIDVEADELAMDLPFDENLVVLDVRRTGEFAGGHVKEAINLPLSEMTDPANMAQLEEHQNIYVHCAGGYRSVIAASLLKRQGFHNLRNVLGGWAAIKQQSGLTTIAEKSALN